MATLKELHTKWKDAKKDAKLFWEELLRQTSDFSAAHEQVKFAVVKFPSFNKDLGPSLDNLFNKKDMKKSKDKADAAVKQYEKDIDGLKKSRAGVKVPETAQEPKKDDKAATKTPKIDLKTVLGGVDKKVEALETVLGEIKKELAKVKV